MTLEAVAVIETGSIARGWVVLDALAKKAPVSIKSAAPVSPGKLVIVFGGELEATREAHAIALEVAGADLVDELLLPGAHARLLPAIDHAIHLEQGESLGIVEMRTVASTILAADTALKAVDVGVVRMHLAVGIGGKGWFTLAGSLADVGAALDAVRASANPERVAGIELIAQPHPEARGFMS